MAKTLEDLLYESYSVEDILDSIVGYAGLRHPKVDEEALEKEWGPYSEKMLNQMAAGDVIKYMPPPDDMPIPYSGKRYDLDFNGVPQDEQMSGAASWRGDMNVQRFLPDPYNPDEYLHMGETTLPEGGSVVFKEGDEGAYVMGHELLHLDEMLKELDVDQHHDLINRISSLLHHTVTM